MKEKCTVNRVQVSASINMTPDINYLKILHLPKLLQVFLTAFSDCSSYSY